MQDTTALLQRTKPKNHLSSIISKYPGVVPSLQPLRKQLRSKQKALRERQAARRDTLYSFPEQR